MVNPRQETLDERQIAIERERSKFRKGKREQREQTRSSRQRLRHGLPQKRLIASRKDVVSMTRGLIDLDLKKREEFWNALNFIKDRRKGMGAQKALGVTLGPGTGFRVFQVGIGSMRKGLTNQSRLAGLSWAQHGDNGVFPGPLKKNGFQLSHDHAFTLESFVVRFKSDLNIAKNVLN